MTNIVIISQNKKVVLNYNNITCLWIEERYYEGKLKEWQIKTSAVGDNYLTTLGSYPSECRCVEVFNAITDEIIRGAVRIEMPEG